LQKRKKKKEKRKKEKKKKSQEQQTRPFIDLLPQRQLTTILSHSSKMQWWQLREGLTTKPRFCPIT